jgi:hypothetical protein
VRTAKTKFEIWIRSASGERRSHHDATWDTYVQAQREILRRDRPLCGEYFIKEVIPPSKDPLGFKRKNENSLSRSLRKRK